jgi:hypothetical protein
MFFPLRGGVTHFCRAAEGVWEQCFSGAAEAVEEEGGEWAFERAQRGPHNWGPMRAVAGAPFVIVVGTGGGEARAAALLAAAHAVAAHHAQGAHATAPVARDTAVALDAPCGAASLSSGALPCGRNLILLGGPHENAVAGDLLARQGGPPLRFSAPGGGAAFSLGGRNFTGEGDALLAVLPWWDPRPSLGGARPAAPDAYAPFLQSSSPARLALLVAAEGPAGIAAALALATPVIPPMVRPPFSNLAPDFMVLGADAPLRGWAGVKAAGSWDSDWRVDEAASFFA